MLGSKPRAQLRLDPVLVATAPKADQRQRGDLLHGRRLGAHRERRSGGHEQDVGVAQHLHGLDAILVHREH